MNPWTMEEFFSNYIFKVMITSNIIMEMFIAFSGFLSAYKLL